MPKDQDLRLALKKLNDAWREENDNPVVPEKVSNAHFAQVVEEYAQLPTETINGIDIFRAGKWTDSSGKVNTWTVEQLQKMVANFATLSNQIKPFLKMRHLSKGDENKITGGASLGWIKNLRMVGDRVIGDISDVPAKLAALIRARRFTRVSAEIFPKFKDSAGKAVGPVLSAVGLLGAQHPAVTTLDDITALHEGDSVLDELFPTDSDWAVLFTAPGAEPYLATYSADQTGGATDMTPEEVQKLVNDGVKAGIDAALEPIKQKQAEYSADIHKALGIETDGDPLKAITTLTSAKTQAEKELGDDRATQFTSKVDTVILQAKKDGKLKPADEPEVRELLEVWCHQAKDGDKLKFTAADGKETEGSPVDKLTNYFARKPATEVDFREHGEDTDKHKQTEGAFVPDDIAALVRTDAGILGIHKDSVARYSQIATYADKHDIDYVTADAKLTGRDVIAEPTTESYSINPNSNELVRG